MKIFLRSKDFVVSKSYKSYRMYSVIDLCHITVNRCGFRNTDINLIYAGPYNPHILTNTHVHGNVKLWALSLSRILSNRGYM